MTRPETSGTDDRDPDAGGFDFTSPRWREQTPAESTSGGHRRFENQPAPEQRGSIDAGNSVPSRDTEA